ncbi:adult-specific rigid cuticular protein 15.7-like, partial [Limulus polyphemus]|uniref:Adult-specific rigid cuticular protein 15.7-like n=1 Tax=Limulus polyphemus TaxID=6850 RepID=A0ABM1C270_LIMPO
LLVVLVLLAASEAGFYGGIPAYPGGYGHVYRPVYPSIPTPYTFNYVAPAIGGISARQESGDGYGRVIGSYKVADADGRIRKVQYTAGPEGFRANVYTNEPGTKTSNPAGVLIQSSAPNPPPYYPPKIPYGGGHKRIIIIPGNKPWKY